MTLPSDAAPTLPAAQRPLGQRFLINFGTCYFAVYFLVVGQSPVHCPVDGGSRSRTG
ncbi:hypothetical protein [Deinococcus sonorensis]|uniref:MFS transporter n=2 Tax=Deinococcus sonorensis TaxID=309891 RepID=A0AAU7UA41_9DEIO